MSYKRIMVAIDGSHTSVLALKEAIQLSENQKARLRIIHVLDDMYEGDVDRDQYIAFYREKGQKILTGMQEIAQQSQVEFEIQLAEVTPADGRVAEKIIKEAKEWAADLIVIGTHGRRGFNHILMGSVAEAVVRIATMPVLLVRSS